ncbi:long-chain-fatty-acid--CoA ligase [Ranunculus cassubicifolius]
MHILHNLQFGPYVWKTYKEVYTEVLHIGSVLRASGANPGSRVGIYGANCPQRIVAMQACGGHSIICVPLYDTLGPGAVDYIVQHAEIEIVFVQDKKLKELLNSDCVSSGRLKLIVCFTSPTKEQENKISKLGMKCYSWDEFLHKGKEDP